MSFAPRACVDGEVVPLSEARVPVTDQGFARGHGAVETIAVWDGAAFRLPDHLERLAASAEAILLPRPSLTTLEQDVTRVLDGVTGDAVVRIYVTASSARVVIVEGIPERPAPSHLIPQVAPWVQPRADALAAGAKTMSTLANVLATKTAQAAGGDDALLISTNGHVLEGPTFAVCWASDGVIHSPSHQLGLVDSVSQRLVLEIADAIGYRIQTGAYTLDDLGRADEVMASSTSRDLIAIRRVGEHVFDERTPTRDRINDELWKVRRGRA